MAADASDPGAPDRVEPRGVAVAGPPGYDALVGGAARYTDASRRVLRVEGDRAADMLQGLLTADIREPGGDGAAFPTLVLTPKGRVLADAVVLRLGETLLLDVPEAGWPELEPHFARYLPPRFAKLEPSGLKVVRLRGPDALARAAEAVPALGGLEPPSRGEEEGTRRHAVALDEAGNAYAARTGGAGGEGLDLYIRREDEPTPIAASIEGPESPFTSASDEAWEVWRVERGIPVYGRDVTGDNLPQETGLVERTTSFSKGCYTGQEVLARIHYRGKVNRRLRGLRLLAGGGEARLEAGTELRRDDRVVGSVTSAADSPRAGWIGLGYVRREVEPGSEVETAPGGRAVRVEEPPLAP